MGALPGTNGRRRVYLMRHGEVNYYDTDGQLKNADTVTLTETGEEQASAMGCLLADVPFDRALCTGLQRTRQTAQLTLANHDIALEDYAPLREMRAGQMLGHSREQIDAAFVYGLERAAEPGARFIGGDNYAEFYARVTDGFQKLLLQPDWSTMLIVAHDGTNRMLLGWVTGAGLAAVGAFEQDPGCLNVIDVDVIDGRIQRRLIKALNLTPTNLTKHGNYLTSLEQVYHTRPGREITNVIAARPHDAD